MKNISICKPSSQETVSQPDQKTISAEMINDSGPSTQKPRTRNGRGISGALRRSPAAVTGAMA
ncbi:Uncharacterised protein [Acinetobacter baumannii]|nr:Uncharacterised protein [Acinetobacter baumannii]